MFGFLQDFSYLCSVKRKHTDIDRMVMEAHYLESLERESSLLMCDMERQDYIDQINELKATIKRLLDMIDTLKQTLDSVTASNKRNEELVVKLTAQVDQLQKMVKNLEDKNQRHNKHTFGKSSLKKSKQAGEKQSREEEKEDYDGNHDNGVQASENTDSQIDQAKVKSEHLDGERAIRPFTVSRKNSLHYSSEDGVETAMTYLTVIETAKMWGLQVKEYLTYVWREVMSGNTDYESMTPEVVIAKRNS